MDPHDHQQRPVQPADGPLPPSPWVLVDDVTLAQSAALLERLVTWLGSGQPDHTAGCADALSLGESDDPVGVASWADALTARLRRCADGGEL